MTTAVRLCFDTETGQAGIQTSTSCSKAVSLRKGQKSRLRVPGKTHESLWTIWRNENENEIACVVSNLVA